MNQTNDNILVVLVGIIGTVLLMLYFGSGAYLPDGTVSNGHGGVIVMKGQP